MCLTVSQKFWSKKVKIAKEDIVCYKTVNPNLTSIAYGFQYELGKMYKNDTSLPDKDSYIEEAFHTYERLDIAYYTAYQTISDLFIVKCIIPKGSRYYKGYHFDSEFKGYASEQIIFQKIVTWHPFVCKYVHRSLIHRGICFTSFKIADSNYQVISMDEYINSLNKLG